jgi:hypothetical protein
VTFLQIRVKFIQQTSAAKAFTLCRIHTNVIHSRRKNGEQYGEREKKREREGERKHPLPKFPSSCFVQILKKEGSWKEKTEVLSWRGGEVQICSLFRVLFYVQKLSFKFARRIVVQLLSGRV